MTAPPAVRRRLLDLSSELLCLTDREGRLLWWNEALAATLDRSPDELAGVALRCFAHPDDMEMVEAASQALRATGTSSETTIRYRRACGESRSIAWRVRVAADGERFYCAGRDVTEQRETLAALEEDEVRLRTIVDHCPLLVFVKATDGRYLLVNREWSRVIGVPSTAAIGRTAAELGDERLLAITEAERQLPQEDGPFTVDQEIETAVGRIVYLAVRFPLLDDQGGRYAVVGVGTEITDRKRAEQESHRRQRLLGSILEASPDIISILDRTGRTIRVSAAEEVMLGHRHEQAMSTEQVFSLVHPDDLAAMADAYADLFAGVTRQITNRARLRHANGQWVPVESRGQALVDDDGGFAGAVVVTRDMSGKLESQQRLQSAITAADQASRAKSEFLSRMSHELRTPLNSILGFAQLLQMDPLAAGPAAEVDHILRAGRHLLDLIDEVLDIARIETGHLELVIEPVSLVQVAAEASEIIGPLAGRAGVTVEVAVDQLLQVQADRHRLLQVLLNLLSNAVKFNRSGGHIRVRALPVAAGQLRLEVTDTGRGIAPKDLDRVFEPFERLGADVSGVEGTGVGLALSRHLIEQMGGRITVDSVLGEGSTFGLILPAAPALVEDTQPGAVQLPTVGPADDGGSGPFRVLLVEDNVANVELVERVLARRQGVEVLAAMQGGMALDLAREHRPGLILLDLQLPDMPGAEVFRLLRRDRETAQVPVAVVSAETPADQVRRLLREGAVAFLAKPLDVRALLALVDRLREAPDGQMARVRPSQ